MRAGLTDAWRQRNRVQQGVKKDLPAQALVGFLTLVLIIALVLGSVALNPAMDVSDLQRQAAEAFKLQVRRAESDDSPAPSPAEGLDSLEGIEGISIHRDNSTLRLVVAKDVLFFPGTADIKDAASVWWQPMLYGLMALDQPLRLSYVQQREAFVAAPVERPDLSEQAVRVGRLFTAKGLTIVQLDVVERWINPYFEGYGEAQDLDQGATVGAIFLEIEVKVPSSGVE